MLFIDWITGDFGILKVDLHPVGPKEPGQRRLKTRREDYLDPPMLLQVHNGMVTGRWIIFK
ncbi:MAG: hypothetical protein LBL04_05720 [Bacteroidales bacterium]|nr:hypothetical protein [Bacteroidales bacterium]